jgi:hypothetical protein
MPVSDLHRQIAALALAAAGEHGFVLGGGNALLAPRGHLTACPGRRLVHRPGARRPGCRRRRGGRAARCGLRTRAAGPGGRAHRHLPRHGRGLAEWIGTAPGGEQTALQLAYSGPGPRAGHHGHRPGPGPGRRRSREGVRAGSRIEPREYADVAAALQRYGPSQLIRLAGRLDPDLPGQDFADAGLRLDQMEIRHSPTSGSARPMSPHCGNDGRRAPGRRSHRPATASRERRRATARARAQPGRHRDAVVYVQAPVSSAAAGCERRPAGRSPA